MFEAPSIANCLSTTKLGCKGVEEEGWPINVTKNK